MSINVDDTRIKICQTTFSHIKAAVTDICSQGLSWEKATSYLINGQKVEHSQCNKLLEIAGGARTATFKTYHQGVKVLNRLSQAETKSPELVKELNELKGLLNKIQKKLPDYQTEYARYVHAVKLGKPIFYEKLTPWIHPDILTAQAVMCS